MTMEEEKTAGKEGIADTGDSVMAFGKGMEPWGKPFSIDRQRGLYYYVQAGHFDRLQEINELAGKDGLPELKVVGRGGMSGNRPFALGGGLYVCILAEHARRLQEINEGLSKPSNVAMPGTIETGIIPPFAEKAPIADKRPETTTSPPPAPPSLSRAHERSHGDGLEPSSEAARPLRVTPVPAQPQCGTLEADAQPETEDAVASSWVPARTGITPVAVQDIAPVGPPEKEGMMEPADEARITTTAASVQEQRQTVLTAEEMRTGDNKDGNVEEKKKQRPEGRYVYCVIKADDKQAKSFGNVGLGSGEVYCIDYKNVSAVVSDFEGIDCGLSEENARVHNEVILRVMERHGGVLPVGFGTVFASKKILKGVLGKTYHVLKEEMKEVENKVELGVKIVVNKGAKSPANAPEEALDALGKIAAKTHKGKAFMNRMLLNASFLVELSRVDEFSRQVEELEKKYSDAVKIQYTGPWPPYNFVSVRIGAAEGG